MTGHSERRKTIADAFDREFDGTPELWVRAPGRLDIMGSYTDFNLCHVLTLTIDRDTWIAARPRRDQKVNLFSLNMNELQSFDLSKPPTSQEHRWALYVQGVAVVLQQAGHDLTGFDGVIHGNLPLGSGLSSSASLEVAAATLFNLMSDLSLDPVEIAKVGLKAENDVVGVNCGILDQYSSVMGRRHTALLVDFRDLTSRKVDFPEDICVVICNTCVPRQLKGSAFDERRSNCEEGAARIAKRFSHVKTLREVTLEQFSRMEPELPGLVAKRSRFIIEENDRVLRLGKALAEDDRPMIRELTAQSYEGARNLFEISIPAMDHMMAAMRSGPGVVGSRQSGAGFGGCMSSFVEESSAADFVAHVEKDYRERSGITPEVYVVHTSDGAGEVG